VATDKIQRFAELIAAEPDNPLHNFALAQALVAAERFEEAEAAFARCLELDPRWMVAAIRRGRCLIALQRWDDARTWLDRGADLATELGHDEPFDEIRELLDEIPD
jgi:predicted Zn-dependent protease